jgi:hypothetical protein
MSSILEEVLSTNAKYVAEFGDKCNLPMPPGKRFATLIQISISSHIFLLLLEKVRMRGI